MQIRTKLLAPLLFLCALIFAQFLIHLQATNEHAKQLGLINEEQDIAARLSRLAQTAREVARYGNEYIDHSEGSASRPDQYESLQSHSARLEQQFNELVQLYPDKDGISRISGLDEWQHAARIFVAAVARRSGGAIADDRDAVTQSGFSEVALAAEAAVTLHLARARVLVEQIAVINERSSLLFVITLDIGLLLGMVLTYLLPAIANKPIVQLTELADGISRGRLNKPVRVRGSSEIKALSESIERLRIAISGLLLRVNETRSGRNGVSDTG